MFAKLNNRYVVKKFFAIIIVSIVLFSLAGFVFAQDRELDIEYPEVAGEQPEQVTIPVTEYFKYVFNFLIWISGVVALIALVIGGILYLTSTGEPEKLSRARKQILAAFFGIIILFSSYLILRTINPDLISFEMPDLEDIVFYPLDIPTPETKVPQLLDKVKEIADNVKLSSEKIKYSAEKIQGKTLLCNCIFTQPLCYCTGGGSGDSCQPRGCYAAPAYNRWSPDLKIVLYSHPCPDESEIKENQKRIIAWKDEIMYYRNRAWAEAEDLIVEIVKVLKAKKEYYQNSLAIETDEKVKEYFNEQIKKLEEEIELKEKLAKKLIGPVAVETLELQVELEKWVDLEELKKLAVPGGLVFLIDQIVSHASEMGTLPDKCLYDEEKYGVNNKCEASCKQEQGYGCHDAIKGCQPDKCKGGNPCPFSEMLTEFGLIEGLHPLITDTSNEILNIIDEIIDFKTIII